MKNNNADMLLLDVQAKIASAEILTEEGERVPVPFREENGRLTIEHPMYTLEPVVLFLW